MSSTGNSVAIDTAYLEWCRSRIMKASNDGFSQPTISTDVLQPVDVTADRRFTLVLVDEAISSRQPEG